MFKKFRDHINNNLAFLKENKLLIAISGGLDSVVLAHLCHQLKLNFALAHCNFNLRREESNTDEDFVMQLAEGLDLEIFVQNFDTETFAKQNKLSIQMAARELRYNWFKELAEQMQFDYILTAHHADDNLETFLINLSRGTGIEGLIGIPEINNKLIRPLLLFSREEIEQYAKTKNLKWREDSSNASTKYLRNKLRHDVIPALKEVNPQLLQNFNKTINYLKDSKDIIDHKIDDVFSRIINKIDENKIAFSIEEIKKLSNQKAYLFEILKDYNFKEWNDVVNLLDAQSGKQVFSKTHRLIKDRTSLLLSEINNNTSPNESEEFIFITEKDKQIQIPIGILSLETSKQINESNLSIIFVDKEKLSFPLTIRKWKEGDLFYPFGMTGKKKLSKYFKDEKFSLLDKENIWLLCSENEIVWVINKRADRRFAVTQKTNQILKIELK